MMALKHHHHDMIVVAAATTDEDDAHKLLYFEGFSCFRVCSLECRFEMWFDEKERMGISSMSCSFIGLALHCTASGPKILPPPRLRTTPG
jgi:hypothetical protein